MIAIALWTVACGGPTPTFAALDLLPATVAPGEDVTVRAEVADPLGADDLVAGWVELGGHEVARFEQGGVPGTFEATIPAGEVLGRLGNEFETSTTLQVKAVFTDTAGDRTSRTHPLVVSCGEGWSWCGTRCVSVDDDPDHCGSCDTVCAQGQTCADAVCTGGPGWTPCTEQGSRDVDCDATCERAGLVCGHGCGSDPIWDDDWARLADSAEGCAGVSGVAAGVVWDGGDCAVRATYDPVWVSCCCRRP